MLAMKHGPVLSETYDLFKFGSQYASWDAWIRGEANFELSFKKMKDVDPEHPLELFDELSRAETQILDAVFSKYGNLTRWEIRDLTHTKECCPEWNDPDGSALPINLRSILLNHGKTEKEADEIIRHVREIDSVQDSLKALS